MRIREARPDEHDAVGALTVLGYASAAHFRVEGNPYVDELRDVAGRAASGTVLVAVEERAGSPGERLIGTATYVGRPGPDTEFDDAGGAGIRMVAVSPDAQGRGVGTALGRACLDLAVADGRDPVVLHTVAGYDLTARLWRRLGFRPDPARDWSPRPEVPLLGWTWRHPVRLAASAAQAGVVERPPPPPSLPAGLHSELVPAADPRVERLVTALVRELAGREGRDPDLGPPTGDGDDVVLVTRDARPVATIALRPHPGGPANGPGGPANGPGGQILRWIVDVDVRGRGIGRRLLADAVAQARHRGWTRLDLVVGERQPEAVALAASAGWRCDPHRAGAGGLRLVADAAGVLRSGRPVPWAP